MLLNSDQATLEACVNQTMTTLEVLGRIDKVETSCYKPDEEEMSRRRLQDLGYLE